MAISRVSGSPVSAPGGSRVVFSRLLTGFPNFTSFPLPLSTQVTLPAGAYNFYGVKTVGENPIKVSILDAEGATMYDATLSSIGSAVSTPVVLPSAGTSLLLEYQNSDSGTYVASSVYAMTYGNGIYVAGGVAGMIATSTDGVTWTSRSANFNAPNVDFASPWDPGYPLYNDYSLTNSDVVSLTYANGMFMAGGSTGCISTSKDGSTWTTISLVGYPASLKYLAYGNGVFVAAPEIPSDSSTVYTSTDGVNWTSRATNFPTFSGEQVMGLTYGEGKFAVMNRVGEISTSTDGVTWALRSGTLASTAYGLGYGDGKFVAVVEDSSTQKMVTSTDALTWSAPGDSTTGAYGARIYYGNGLYVLTATSTLDIYVSTDAVSWELAIATGSDLSAFTLGNDKFILAAGSQVVATDAGFSAMVQISAV